jgi:hypothetical protein
MRATRTATAAEQLLSMWDIADPWSYDLNDIAALQLSALRDRFAERRGQLKVLDQRARDQGIDQIDRLEDAVPLLFSHTTYKSYPESIVTKGQWKLLTRWLGTLSTASVDNVDLTGVETIDDWVDALHRAGHYVVSSSGTTGQASFVNHAPSDREHIAHTIRRSGEVSCGLVAEPIHPLFAGSPRAGRNMGAEIRRLMAQIYAKPGDVHYLTDEYVSIAELNRLAAIRRAMIDGTATAGLIADVESEAAERQAFMEANIVKWIDALLERRHERMILYAGPAMLWRIVEHGRAKGIPDGDFDPEMYIKSGGGMKGFRGPANFMESAREFFGVNDNHFMTGYGMTELLSPFQGCSQRANHAPPTTILLLLDKSGEVLINQPSSVVEGRGGFFDRVLQGRWGGVISGDRIKVNFGPCPCGRKSPSVIEITRYTDLPEGDDKLTCAGQIDTYIRGFTGGDWQS